MQKTKKTKTRKVTAFSCWYCSNGSRARHMTGQRGGAYRLCKCGASTVSMISLKVSRNRRGGVKAVNWAGMANAKQPIHN